MIQGYISRLIFNKNLLVSTGVFIFHNPPLTPWAWGEYFFMLRGEIMKNWTSKGHFSHYFRYFLPKNLLIFPNPANKILKNVALRIHLSLLGEKKLFSKEEEKFEKICTPE